MRYRLDLAYNGASFCGWQIQPHSPSVQGALESALGTLLRTPAAVTGAGRTDTGGHASRYTAHFDFDGELDCRTLRHKLNSILPEGIAIISLTRCEDGFHARFDATRREYRYFLNRVKDPFIEGTSYFYGYPEVDFEAMNKAAEALLGRHDFSCFEKSGGDNKTSICDVFAAGWHSYIPTHAVLSGNTGNGAEYWYFEIAADRFLRNMVRAIVGTLLEVGRGRRTVEEFGSLVLPALDAEKCTESRRSCAGESVPGHALFLSGIEYQKF